MSSNEFMMGITLESGRDYSDRRWKIGGKFCVLGGKIYRFIVLLVM